MCETVYFKLQDHNDIIDPISVKFPDTLVNDFIYQYSYISNRWGRINVYKHKATKRDMYIDKQGHTYDDLEHKIQPYQALIASVGDYYAVHK